MSTLKTALDMIKNGVTAPRNFSDKFDTTGCTAQGGGNKNKYHSVRKDMYGPMGKFVGAISISYPAHILDPEVSDMSLAFAFSPGDKQKYGGYNFQRDWKDIVSDVASRAGTTARNITNGYSEDFNGYQIINFKLTKKNFDTLISAALEYFNEFADKNSK